MRNWMNLIEHAASGDQVAELVFQDMDWSSGNGDTVIADYLRNNSDDDDSDSDSDSDHEFGELAERVDIHSPKFKTWFTDWVEEQYGEAEWEIQNKIHDGRITLWRCITAPRDWKPDPSRHPGIYWSWDEQAADAHWGSFNNGQIKWMIEGSISEHDVDWLQTLAMNAQPSYQEEREVRIKEGADVKILRVYPQKNNRGW